jgi:hypothetical protein
MLTTTHALLNTALLGRKNKPERNWPLILGACLPDLPGFLNLVMKTVDFISNKGVWDKSYYSPAWVPWVDWAHSIPLALAPIPLFFFLKYRFGLCFCLSMALHDIEDLFVHSLRSHRHFLPFSDYRFISPISCQEPQFHAALVFPLEWALAMGCVFVLWRRDPPPWIKGALVIVCIGQGIGVIHFLLIGRFG